MRVFFAFKIKENEQISMWFLSQSRAQTSVIFFEASGADKRVVEKVWIDWSAPLWKLRQAYYVTHWPILSEIVQKLKIEKSIAAWKNDKFQSEIEIKWWLMFESSMAPKWPILISFWEWIIETQIFHWYLVPFLSRAVEVDDSRTLVDKTH